MRKYIYFTLAMFMAFSQLSLAQLDRSKLPEPGQAREIKIGDYKSFTLKNGLKVFVIENTKLPRVSFTLVLDRKPVLEGEKVGYLSMVGNLMRRGTTSRTKDKIDNEVDFIGASLSASSGSVFASGLSKYTEEVIELMADITLNPSFPEEELEKIKTQALSSLAQQKDNANSISGNLSTVLVFGKDHPYGELRTEESIGKIEVADIKSYYATYFKPNISYMAIVGDIKKKDAEKLVKKYFSNWERGEIPQIGYENPNTPEKTTVALVDRPASVQSVVNITHSIDLKPGTEDVIPARIMNNILGGGGSARLFTNLREDKGYTYGAYSQLGSNRLVGSFSANASVRNEVTDSAIVEFMSELRRIRETEVTDQELNLAINSISGGFARSLEQPSTVANFALNIERFNLPNDYYSTYLQKVQAVTKEDVQRMAQKYIQPDNAYITVVGKASDVSEKLKKFGELKYYDIYGEEYVPAEDGGLPDGLTAAKVIADYIEAIGGKEKVNAIKDITSKSAASVQGQNLDIVSIKKSPNLSYSSIKVGGAFEVQKSVFDGVKMAQFIQGQKAPDDAK
ncbi:MAG: pitrilysin family protein, partial [Bacteroidota bacterium]